MSAGVVVTNGSGDVVCALPTFDASGQLIAFGSCFNFAVLGR
ncbi:MAG TPA: hypothetical protein VKE51_29690 [Vicinamibacterales bacterium]|nr:hypothetical protein [Vicinamibacterales bacterium]